MFAGKTSSFARRAAQRLSRGFSGATARARPHLLRKLAPYAVLGGASAFLYSFATKAAESGKVARLEQALHAVEVGASDDFLEGQLREVKVGATDKDTVLVVRLDGQLYACGSKCSHFGAPLSKGMLFEDRIYCPFHLASFSVKSGFPDNGPMMDGIPVYEVSENRGKVTVKVPKQLAMRKPVPVVTRDPKNKERYVIVGGGIAASSAADTLRQSGFTGEIVMLTKEDHLPYDRTILTKNVGGVKVENITYRDADYLSRVGIDVRTGTRVTKVDANTKTVTTATGEHIAYDKVLIATGTSARVPDLPGVELSNVFSLRDFDDAVKVRDAVKAGAKKVVVLGGGFIGVEIAGNLKAMLKDAASVQVVTKSPEPYSSSLGASVGRAMRVLGEQNGVEFITGTKVAAIEGDQGAAQKVTFADGRSVEADVVVVGKGAVPNTWFLEGVALDRDGGINADVFMRSTSNGDVYAAGDVVSYPYFYTAERIRVEHISEAISQGAYAAYNMVGKMRPYDGVPFYWTRAFNQSLACIGVTRGHDQVIIDGDVDKQNFAAYYLKEGEVIGASGMKRGKDLIVLNQAMRMNIRARISDFEGTALNLDKIQKEIAEKRPRCGCMRESILRNEFKP